MSFKEIRILILSKHRPEKIRISLNSGILSFDDREEKISNADILIEKSPAGLLMYHQNKKTASPAFHFRSAYPFTLTLYGRVKTISRSYRGGLDVSVKDGSLEIVNTADAEEYVHSSAIAELGELLWRITPARKKELVGAMEIAIRSYIFHFRDRHPGNDYDFCDLTHCVFFPGINSRDAESLTPGLVMVDEKKNIIPGYFHSTCGGILSGPETCWQGHVYHENFRRDYDKVSSSGDDLCFASPHYRWSASISKNDMDDILGDDVKSIAAGDGLRYGSRLFSSPGKDSPGRITVLEYYDINGSRHTVPVSRFLSSAGRKLGWNVIKSNCFRLTETPSGWKFDGRGLGHGAGMCQWGARRLAGTGRSYTDIINFYYNKPEIVRGRYQ